MSIFTRDVLERAFPKNPRAVAAFERLDALLSDVDGNGQSLTDKLDSISDSLSSQTYQSQSPLLSSISELPNRVGAIELTQDGVAQVREIDALDPASLLSRGVAYTVLVGAGGRGSTAQRPTVPANALAIYFDTDLDPDGQPIFWTGIKWVNSGGAPV